MSAQPAGQSPSAKLEKTPLNALHLELGGKMVPFAGYDMPLQYPMGIMQEHLHTRAAAGLFDVSHMGQYLLSAPSGTAALLEELVPGNITGLAPGRMRYTQLTNTQGGIIDDLMVTNIGARDGREWLFLVFNAARKHTDAAHIREQLGGRAALSEIPGQALMALQGPKAAAALATIFPGCDDIAFMTMRQFPGTSYGDVWLSRSGYTGEDGFEISVAGAQAEPLARGLLEMADVAPIGLGARDSLRLEAGLCLYGHDIDTTTSPVEANLVWSIGKSRREKGGFLGDGRILAELSGGPERKLVGLKPEGRAPAREGTEIETPDGATAGVVTSGGYAPTVSGPIALGYVKTELAAPGTRLNLVVRGRALPASVVETPFVPNRYFRKKAKT